MTRCVALALPAHVYITLAGQSRRIELDRVGYILLKVRRAARMQVQKLNRMACLYACTRWRARAVSFAVRRHSPRWHVGCLLCRWCCCRGGPPRRLRDGGGERETGRRSRCRAQRQLRCDCDGQAATAVAPRPPTSSSSSSSASTRLRGFSIWPTGGTKPVHAQMHARATAHAPKHAKKRTCMM